MPQPRHRPAFFLRRGALACLFIALTARAHDSISFDPNAPPAFNINGNWTASNGTPVVIQGLVTARLRADSLDIDLKMADGAAYKLLEHDPYVAPNPAAGATAPDPHFTQDRALLAERAATFFDISSNGAALQLAASSVELTAGLDVIFHLAYPRASAGTLSLRLNYFAQVPKDEKVIVLVLSGAQTIFSETLSAESPALTVQVPAAAALPGGTAAPKGGVPWFGLAVLALTIAALAVAFLRRGRNA